MILLTLLIIGVAVGLVLKFGKNFLGLIRFIVNGIDGIIKWIILMVVCFIIALVLGVI